MRIGTSVSFCIRDIIFGSVREDEIEKIIGATSAPDREGWGQVIEHYKDHYWHHDPEEGEAIALRLLDAGKILQPKLDGMRPPASRRTWVNFPDVSSLPRTSMYPVDCFGCGDISFINTTDWLRATYRDEEYPDKEYWPSDPEMWEPIATYWCAAKDVHYYGADLEDFQPRLAVEQARMRNKNVILYKWPS